MTDKMTAFCALGILAGLGFLFFVAGIWVKASTKRKNAKCTEYTEGKIIKHKFPGDNRVIPVVEYTVSGRLYHTVKKYNGCKEIKYSLPVKSVFWEDEKGYICKKLGIAVNVRKIANEMWPIGSAVKVFYSPSNPKINYVDRPINNEFIVNFFMIWCIGLVIMGVVLFLLISNGAQ